MTTITPPTADQAAKTGAKSAPATISADLNMFLKMLTTQMQNQDPLNPMDSTQYTQQLAQYSQVEQTVQQTGTLKDILSHLTGQDMAQAASFIGREAQFASSVSGLTDDQPARWGYNATIPIDTLVATVSDANGAVVATRSISAAGSAGRFEWDGALAKGGKAADGAYSVSFAATDKAGATIPVNITSVGVVEDVVNSSGAVSLGLNGVRLPMSALLSLTQAKTGNP
jgi:flagellar basal-body rod modification protein FlgD